MRAPTAGSCKKSIERLKCEYIDLYQIHWPSRDCPLMSTPTFAPGGKNRFMPAFDKGTQEDFDVRPQATFFLFHFMLKLSSPSFVSLVFALLLCVRDGASTRARSLSLSLRPS